MKKMVEIEIKDDLVVSILRDEIDTNWCFGDEPDAKELHTSFLNLLAYYMIKEEFDLYCNAHKNYLKKKNLSKGKTKMVKENER